MLLLGHIPGHELYHKCIFSKSDSGISVRLPWCTESRIENAYKTHITNADNRFQWGSEQLVPVVAPPVTCGQVRVRNLASWSPDLTPTLTPTKLLSPSKNELNKWRHINIINDIRTIFRNCLIHTVFLLAPYYRKYTLMLFFCFNERISLCHLQTSLLQAGAHTGFSNGGTTLRMDPHADWPLAEKNRRRSSMHPGRSQSQ